MNETIQLAKSIQEELKTLRRAIHQCPEIGFDVHKTAKRAADYLNSLGLSVTTGVGQTGVVADLIVPGAEKRIALRADMDALPIQEATNAPYASLIPGKAHLCGHDAHTAMLLGAAKLLRERAKVHVRFLFQPSEEAWPGGAKGMIEEGVLEGVDEVYGLHVWPALDVGHYGISVGPAMAQADGFEILIKGKGGHAAVPDQTIDPIVTASQVILALQTIVSRSLSPTAEAVLSITQIHSGHSYNVIEDTCKIIGTVRTFSSETQKTIKFKMKDIVEGIASAHGAIGELHYNDGYPPVVNDEQLARKAKERAASLVGEASIHFPAPKALFGEDFAYYAQAVKGCFIQLGCRQAKGQQMLHHPEFDIDEECLVYGTALFVQLVGV